MERVLFGRRPGAFAIDALLLGIALTFVHRVLVSLLGPLMGGMGSAPTSRLSASHHVDSWWQLLPWGYHDPTVAFALQAVIALASAVTVLGYFTWFEAREGRSLGKCAPELRVARVDGQPVTYRESFVRNLVKLMPLALIVDTLIMLIAFRHAGQRLSDRIAETLVVRA